MKDEDEPRIWKGSETKWFDKIALKEEAIL